MALIIDGPNGTEVLYTPACGDWDCKCCPTDGKPCPTCGCDATCTTCQKPCEKCKERYPTVDDAAIAAMKDNDRGSVASDLEHGGLIQRNADGTFSPGEAVIGQQHSMPNMPTPDANTAGWWHTHGADNVGYDDEFFSGANGDQGWSNHYGIPGYLATPSGVMQRYDPATGTITTLPGSAF